eukprot:4864863-Prymnesium_polylepis.1
MSSHCRSSLLAAHSQFSSSRRSTFGNRRCASRYTPVFRATRAASSRSRAAATCRGATGLLRFLALSLTASPGAGCRPSISCERTEV